MTHYNKALISLQSFEESRNLDISLHYKKSEFIEDWLKESDRVWVKDLDFLLASSEDLVSVILEELDFFKDKLQNYPWKSGLDINKKTISDEIGILNEETWTYPIQRIDIFGQDWKIEDSNCNNFFDLFIGHQKQLEKVIIFKEELVINLKYYKEKEGTPPFKPNYSNINKIPTWGSINKTAGIFGLLIKHKFLLANEDFDHVFYEKYGDEISKELKSKAISKEKFAEIISNTFYNVKIKDKKVVETKINSGTIKSKLKERILEEVNDSDLEGLIIDLTEMIEEFEEMKKFLQEKKKGKMKNKRLNKS
ncbi:hypothetical protein [Algoriphagus formosus]|uniref:hypothetical protein n=1 Tax=Algoriphagus formosus TaxID=2007308 RepID=UPI000C28A373|nr:hypothetical protein [Algoriphagus formosus]